MVPGAGFHGKLSNVDVSSDTSIDHFTIDKSPRLQATALNSVLQAAHGQSCRPGVTGPVVAEPKAPATPKVVSTAKSAASTTKPASPIPPTKNASPAVELQHGYAG
jgi:hypothetical protein